MDMKGGHPLSKEVVWLLFSPMESWYSRYVSLENGDAWFSTWVIFVSMKSNIYDVSSASCKALLGWKGVDSTPWKITVNCKIFVLGSGLPCLSMHVLGVFETGECFWAGADLG